jgi:hypothetical protein
MLFSQQVPLHAIRNNHIYYLDKPITLAYNVTLFMSSNIYMFPPVAKPYNLTHQAQNIILKPRKLLISHRDPN